MKDKRREEIRRGRSPSRIENIKDSKATVSGKAKKKNANEVQESELELEILMKDSKRSRSRRKSDTKTNKEEKLQATKPAAQVEKLMKIERRKQLPSSPPPPRENQNVSSERTQRTSSSVGPGKTRGRSFGLSHSGTNDVVVVSKSGEENQVPRTMQSKQMNTQNGNESFRRQTKSSISKAGEKKSTREGSVTYESDKESVNSTDSEDSSASSVSVTSMESESSISSVESSKNGIISLILQSNWKKNVGSISNWLWHLFPMIFALVWLIQLKFRPSGVASGLSRYDVRAYKEDGSVVLHNQTVLYSNGTLRFFNGTFLFQDGSVLHTRPARYEDLAECSASRVSLNTRHAIQAYLGQAANQAATSVSKGLPQSLKYCGFVGEGTFSSRSGMLSSQAPVLYPRNDTQLQEVVKRIGDAGCKIRPVGSKHSESGINMNTMDDMSVGVSLAYYRADALSEWALENEEAVERLLNKEGRIRLEAGHTLLKLNSIIRPRSWYLPTLPLNWATTAGSVVADMVHGAGFGKSHLNSYATRLRVIVGDGRIVEIIDPLELAMWRNSMGLIGLIIGVEFQLEHREFFSMGSRQSVVHHWSPWYLDSVISSLLPGADGAEYLFDPWTDELVGVGYVTKAPVKNQGFMFNYDNSQHQFISDNDCTFDLQKLSCNFPEFCEYRFQFGDFLPAQSCRLKRKPNPSRLSVASTYKEMGTLMEQAALFGLPSVKDGASLQWWDQHSHSDENMHASGDTEGNGRKSSQWMDNLAKAVNQARERINDGFWMFGADKTVSMSYLFPVTKLFEALDIHRTLARELVIKNAQFQFRDAPVHFRFLRFEKKQVLQPKGIFNGDFVNIEIKVNVQCSQAGRNDQAKQRCNDSTSWRYALLELEKRWLYAFRNDPVFPHLGSVYGFHLFQLTKDSRLESLKSKFRRARRVREAFTRLKRRFETQFRNTGGSGGGFSSFFGQSVPSYEEANRIVDPSLEMIAQIESELSVSSHAEEQSKIAEMHQAAYHAINLETEYFGDLEHELYREAYRVPDTHDEYHHSEASAAELKHSSLPMPFTNPEIMHYMFPKEVALAFLRYRQRLDPENRFWGGGATRFFSKEDKHFASNDEDPDLLEEDYFILHMKTFANMELNEQDAKKTAVLSAIVIAGVLLAGYQVVILLCKRSKGRRSRASSTSSSSSDGSSSSHSSESSGSQSSDESSEDSDNSDSSKDLF